MKNSIKHYYKKLNRECPDYYNTEDFSSLEKEIKKNFKCGSIPLQRQEKTDISPFEKEFGFRLPIEIVQYINLFWHSYICGYVDDSECIILFSVLKREGDSSDDILFYENGLLDMAHDWAEIGDILEDGINQGKVFYFSHNPAGDTGALGGEYRCLLANEYEWDPITMTMKLEQ